MSVAAVFGSFSVRKTFAHASIAAELRDLAFDPERGEPAEVQADPAIERRHREDLAVAVEQVLDLGHLARLSASPAPLARRDQGRRPQRTGRAYDPEMGDGPSREELEAVHCWETDDRVPGRPAMTEFRRTAALPPGALA